MEVGRQDAAGDDLDRAASDGDREQAEEGPDVGPGLEDGPAGNAAVHDVVELARPVGSGGSGHGETSLLESRADRPRLRQKRAFVVVARPRSTTEPTARRRFAW